MPGIEVSNQKYNFENFQDQNQKFNFQNQN